MRNIFQDTLEQFDVITIFRHENPDMDALGSQYGLCDWINTNYPGKKVYLCGYESGRHNKFDSNIELSEEIIKDSLAIILDTANAIRVDDQRFKLAKKSMRIDHHPFVEKFADIEIIKEASAATCQLLGELFLEIDEDSISLKAAEYLYQGILTDTLCFRSNNTTPITLYVASKLAEVGINISEINQKVFDIDLKTFYFINMLRNKIKSVGGVAYAIITPEDVQSFELSTSQAREYVSEFGIVKDYKIWCMFTMDDDGIHFKGSLRSKTIPINEVAAKYHGGGHKNACGVKNLTLETIDTLLIDLQGLL